MIDSEDHEGIEGMRAKLSLANALPIIFLALVACGGFVLFWSYILLITSPGGLP